MLGHHPRCGAHRELFDLPPQLAVRVPQPSDEEIIAAFIKLSRWGQGTTFRTKAPSSSGTSDEESDNADADEGEAGDAMQTE